MDTPKVRVADETVDSAAAASMLRALPIRPERFPLRGEVLVQYRESDVGQKRREDATLRSAGDRLTADALFGEDACSQKRRHELENALVFDSPTQPRRECGVVDGIKAGRDVSLERPFVVSIG